METVYVNAIFTGICSFVIGDEIGEHTAKDVRFVMPNARKWQRSQNNKGVLLPPHYPFLIAREVDVARTPKGDEQGKWVGRRPTGRLLDRWVYWIIKDETLRFEFGTDKGTQPPLTIGSLRDVADLHDLVGKGGEVDDVCLQGRCRRVAARVVFDRGVLSQRSLTTDKFYFVRPDQTETPPKELVDELQVALPAVPLVPRKANRRDGVSDDADQRADERFLVITPRALDDDPDDSDDEERRVTRDIILSPQQPLIHLYFGSAPESDLGAVVAGYGNHEHGTSNLHFEFHYEVSRKKHNALPVPKLYGPGSGGPLAGTDGCPPAHGG
jgi:hypothetical protein